MISLEDYRSLNDMRRRALAILTFWAEPVDADRLSALTADAEGHCILIEKAKKILSGFAKSGWVEFVSKDRRTAFMTHPVARAAYEEMVREADEKDWWPRVEVAGKKPEEDLFPELHRRRATTVRTEPSVAMLLSEGLRLMAVGSGEKASERVGNLLMSGETKEAPRPDFVRAIAHCAGCRFGEEPNFRLTENDPLLGVLPAWFTACFVQGCAITRALDELHRMLSEGATFSDRLLDAYCALCVWSGKTNFLTPASERFSTDVLNGCEQISSGDFKMADATFKMSEINDQPEGDDLERDYDNLPVRYLMAMTAAVVKPEKLAKKRPCDLMCFCGGYYGYRGEGYFAAKRQERAIERLCRSAEANWQNLGADHSQINLLGEDVEICPVPALLAAWDYRQMKTGRKAFAAAAARIWAYAKELDKAGWSSLANLLSTLLTGGYDRVSETEYLRDLDGRSVHFLQRLDPEPEWKGALAALQKAVPKRRRGEADADAKPTGNRFLWSIDLKKPKGEELCSLGYFVAAIRRPGDPEDGSRDEILDHFDLAKDRVRRSMSEKDLVIAAELTGPGSGGRSDWRRLLKLLCGAPNLVRREHKDNWSWGGSEWKRAYAMTLESRTCELSTTAGEDGGVVLQVSEWAINCKRDWCVRELGGGKYAYVEFSSELKKILGVFGELGAHGRIAFPREGLRQAEAIIGGLSSVMQIAEPTEGTEGLRRVPAASAVRLWLEYANGVLQVRAVVRPLADNPNIVLDPAYGPVEKLVIGAVANFVLVRDLAAEKAAFDPVRAAMADFEGSFDGKATWRFDEIADALAALAKLKALGDRAPLEWSNDRRLSVVQMPKSGVKLTSQRTADDWFRVDGSFELDDGRILSIVALLDAARARHGNYVRISDGDYVALTTSMAKELDALNASGRRKGDGVEIVKAAIPMLDGVFGEGDDALELPDAMAVTAREIRAAFAKRPDVPRTLAAELRPYQEDGYRWLSRLAACGFGSCLADDMGLGKTIQVISLLLERSGNGASLVIAPSSVCGNWRRELERFAPTLRPVVALEETEPLSCARANDVVIASYGYLLFHEEEFVAVNWNGLILDEAQAIKNDASKRARAVKRLHAKFRVAATGTPVENRLGELWSLFDFLNPGLLGPAASFAQRFTADGKALPELKRLVKPLILRRLKGDVLDDLPDKTEVTIPVVLGKSERTAYEACRRQALDQLAMKVESDGAANRMSILAELTRLRRFCCHPSLVLPGMGVPSAKMEALVELLEGLREGHHRALVFSQFTDYLSLVGKTLDAHGWTHLYLDGSTPTLEREKLVNAFQGGEGDFFLISLKAGGTGLNLTAANYVILLDPWWNPAVENQAADRAHRIGQKNPVTVYRLISSDTVEARVIELHQEKKAIAEDVLEGTGKSALTPETLMKLFG